MVGFYKSLERYFSGRLARTWFARPNTSPLFAGARPVETATEGGLPQILAIRTFFDALRGGTRKTKPSVRGPVRCCQQPTALGGLVDADELQVLAEIEGQRRLLAKRGNSEERGAWFWAWDVMVSVSGVAWHRARELGFTGWFCDRAHVALLADFIAEFGELTDEPSHPALNPEPAVGYPEGRIWRPDYGMRGPWPDLSVRAAGGNSLACFEPRAVRSVRPGRPGIWCGKERQTIRSSVSKQQRASKRALTTAEGESIKR